MLFAYPCEVCKTFNANSVGVGGPSAGDLEAMNTRQKQWLARKSPAASGGQVWRVPKVHRRSVSSVICNIDAQLARSTCWEGLSQVCYKKEDATWSASSWKEWPALSLVQDQGPDCMSAVHCMHYRLGLNLTEWWDWSHGAQNDAKHALKQAGLWPLTILMLICNNIGHGPERDELLRFNQLQEVLKVIVDNFDHRTSELFKARAPDMLLEMQDTIEFDDTVSANENLWNHIKSHAQYPKLGKKVRLCQFLGFQEENQRMLKDWACRLWKAEMLALECDWLKGKEVDERVKVSTSVLEAADACTSTAAKGSHPDIKLLRGAQQNAAVIVVLTLGEPTHKRIITGVTKLLEPLQHWRGSSAKTVRGAEGNEDTVNLLYIHHQAAAAAAPSPPPPPSTPSAAAPPTSTINACCCVVLFSEEWLVQQMKGGYYAQITDTFKLLEDSGVATACGFSHWESGSVNSNQDAAYEEDERLAELLGHFTLSLGAGRVRRAWYAFEGWPHRLLRLLISDEEAVAVVAEFKADYEAHTTMLSDDVPKTKKVTEIITRSVFALPKVLQWIHAFQASGWVVNDDIKAMAKERAQASTSSLVSEELVHYGKNMTRAKNCKKLRRPQKCFATAVDMEILHKRFHYNAFPISHSLPRKSARLLV